MVQTSKGEFSCNALVLAVPFSVAARLVSSVADISGCDGPSHIEFLTEVVKQDAARPGSRELSVDGNANHRTCGVDRCRRRQVDATCREPRQLSDLDQATLDLTSRTTAGGDSDERCLGHPGGFPAHLPRRNVRVDWVV